MAIGSGYKIYSTSEEAWGAMYQAISGAKKSIYWELYIFLDDEAGNPFFDLLEKKAGEGVDVKLIVDSVGSFWLSRKRTQALKKAGVDIRFFHERKNRYRGLWKKLITRTHRKVLVVDEKIGLIGGVNIRKKMKDWQDINIRISGKAVHSLLRSFAKLYIICGGDRKDVRHLLKYKFRVEHDEIDFFFDDAHDKRSNIRKKYSEALLKARERVILFSPYYFPDKKFLYALWKARKRGVKVDLLVPFRTDIRIAQYVAYASFAVLQKLGVNIHLSDNMMHGKGVIVDDDYAMIGSSNLDQTSFYDNYEASVGLKNKRVVKKLKGTLLHWIKISKKLEDTDWVKRGRWQKFKERVILRLYNSWHGHK